MFKKRPFVLNGEIGLKDERGEITNFYPSRPIKMVGIITSNKAGDVRANHWHPKEEQNVLVIKGGYISLWRDREDPEKIIHHHLVKKGQIEIMPSNTDHAMIFLEPSEILNLVDENRDKEGYNSVLGHTVRLEQPLIDTKDEIKIKEYLERYHENKE